MPGGVSSAGETIALNALLAGTIYVSLHSADPGNTGASELSGGGYARQANNAWTASGGNPTTDANTNIIAWPAATLDWNSANPIGYFGFWTALTGGTFLGGAALTTPRTILANDVARFLVGALTVSAD